MIDPLDNANAFVYLGIMFTKVENNDAGDSIKNNDAGDSISGNLKKCLKTVSISRMVKIRASKVTPFTRP